MILLGDAPYYARFGFSALKTGELSLPGPFERDRLLGLELREGALDGACGMIVPTGASVTEPRRSPEPRLAAPGRRGRSGMPPDCRMPWQPADPPRATPRIRAAGPSPRSCVIMIAVMIVRDIFVRRWGAATPRLPDVTQRSR